MPLSQRLEKTRLVKAKEKLCPASCGWDSSLRKAPNKFASTPLDSN